jgi:DNA adenine methylase
MHVKIQNNKLVQPVLKWAGGKRQLLHELNKYTPNINEITTYYEPFVGGGALLFNLQPKKAVVNDVNADLINLYMVIKDNVEELIEDLKKHKNEKDYFYEIRALDRTKKYKELSNIEKASRIIYLNKTCFNGLFRVNKAGEFNVPFGNYKNPNIVNEITLRAVSKYFNQAKIKFLNCDFEESLKGIRKGSFVYFDPPYDPVSDSSSFTGYTLDGFNKDDQRRLKKLCDRLNEKGIKFLLSNSATDFIIDLYSENKDFKIEIVNATRCINADAEKRGEINEVLIRNY